MNSSDALAFSAGVTGGNVTQGVFKAAASIPVPALGAYSLGFACLALGIAGVLFVLQARRRDAMLA